MTLPEKSLQSMQATDLMSRDVMLIPDDIPVRDAARRLVRAQISGAPVVDYRGKLVGVISSSDFVRQMTGNKAAPGGMSECAYSEWQVVDADELPTEAVRHAMTADPVTAREETSVADLARMMVGAHIHRVIIVDGNHAPVGIVTTTDIIAAVSRLSPFPAPLAGPAPEPVAKEPATVSPYGPG